MSILDVNSCLVAVLDCDIPTEDGFVYGKLTLVSSLVCVIVSKYGTIYWSIMLHDALIEPSTSWCFELCVCE